MFSNVHNVQITLDKETRFKVDRIAKSIGLKRSEIVRQALREWLHRHAV
jgi:metal-responsive CopG/Arc/MetJ family transcriptional regulator